jgi:hypothetical protein
VARLFCARRPRRAFRLAEAYGSKRLSAGHPSTSANKSQMAGLNGKLHERIFPAGSVPPRFQPRQQMERLKSIDLDGATLFPLAVDMVFQERRLDSEAARIALEHSRSGRLASGASNVLHLRQLSRRLAQISQPHLHG